MPKNNKLIKFPKTAKERNNAIKEAKRRKQISELDLRIEELRKIRKTNSKHVENLKEEIIFTEAQIKQTPKSRQAERKRLQKKVLDNKIDLNEFEILNLRIDLGHTENKTKREQIIKKIQTLSEEIKKMTEQVSG
jgi:type I site-specific restriction endonuclease